MNLVYVIYWLISNLLSQSIIKQKKVFLLNEGESSLRN